MAPLWIYSTLVLLIWTCHTHQQEEEIFNSDKQSTLGWSSEPQGQWSDVQLGLGTNSPVPVLQACGKRIYRTVLSKWMERKDAHYLLMDVTFAQEQEPDDQPRLLRVHLFDSDTPITTFRNRQAVVDLETTERFPSTATHQQIPQYMRSRTALSLGSVRHRGFQLAFSYSGTCVLVTSIRLYYRKCPDMMHQLVSFHSTGAGSGRLTGTCVKGAVEFSTPVRECNTDGVWGPLEGGCSCRPGHQVVDRTCQACHMGFYKPANANEGCRPCPANTRTHNEGSERCSCVQGFSRLPNDTDGLGCTKPPSAPVNLTAQHHNDSVLLLTWDPPHDWGGRQEMTYRIKCEEEDEASGQWGPCKNDAGVILPDTTRLSGTSVSIIGLNPQNSYKLSVQAWNDISSLQGAPPSSTTTVIIHRWKAPPVVITVTPGLNATQQERTAAPQHQGSSSAWLTLAVSLGLLVLVPVVLLALWVVCRDSAKFRPHRRPDLLPLAVAFSYRRPEEVEITPQQLNSDNGVEGVAQLLEGISDRMLASLREVLVERAKLTLGKELGRGEFGSVYEGVFNPDEGMEIKVAVKTMRVGILSREDLHEFLREAEIMQNFDHENVIKLLGVTLQREQDCPLPVPLVILPYMKHGDLRRFLIDTRYGDTPMFVPHQSLLRFMIDIATGMDYLSSQGFLHRDLAARNCMLSDDLRVCVADFGLSKKIYSSNYYRQNVAIRVPIKWMAMESLSLSVYTTKSDVWSFGVTMWEIVSRGRTPYPGVQNSELLDLLLSGHRLKTPTDCDDKLYKVMQSCWEEEPARRPSFRQLTQMLKGLLSELPVLEASEEVSYINQVLEVSAAAGVHQNPHTHYGERWENVYLSNPVTAAAEVDVEDGYLKCFTDSAVNFEDH